MLNAVVMAERRPACRPGLVRGHSNIHKARGAHRYEDDIQLFAVPSQEFHVVFLSLPHVVVVESRAMILWGWVRILSLATEGGSVMPGKNVEWDRTHAQVFGFLSVFPPHSTLP